MAMEIVMAVSDSSGLGRDFHPVLSSGVSFLNQALSHLRLPCQGRVGHSA